MRCGNLTCKQCRWLSNLVSWGKDWPCSVTLLLLIVHFSASCGVAWAQGETTSAIVGQVTDATNAAVPGAKVTITSRETGLTRSVQDRRGGAVQFPPAKTWRLLG